MQQDVHNVAVKVVVLLFTVFAAVQCQHSSCRDISGRWTNREGQSFDFQANGKGKWMVRFGSQTDTVAMEYQYACKTAPATLDFSGFASGPLKGKALYGILEWTSDTSFRFDAEAGAGSEVRPATFNNEQTQQFFREK